jgi:hypothetical protein
MQRCDLKDEARGKRQEAGGHTQIRTTFVGKVEGGGDRISNLSRVK